MSATTRIHTSAPDNSSWSTIDHPAAVMNPSRHAGAMRAHVLVEDGKTEQPLSFPRAMMWSVGREHELWKRLSGYFAANSLDLNVSRVGVVPTDSSRGTLQFGIGADSLELLFVEHCQDDTVRLWASWTSMNHWTFHPSFGAPIPWSHEDMPELLQSALHAVNRLEAPELPAGEPAEDIWTAIARDQAEQKRMGRERCRARERDDPRKGNDPLLPRLRSIWDSICRLFRF